MSGSYRRLHILMEGATEETIVREVVAPHLESFGWHVTTSILVTKRLIAQPAQRGGVSSWAKLRRELQMLLRDPSLALLTTLLDYYGFPVDAPGMSNRPDGDAQSRVMHVEHSLQVAMADERFIAHLVLHETEAWAFAAADQLGELAGQRKLAAKLHEDASRAGGPEQVNDGPSTAPSKRIRQYWPSYSKTLDGPVAIAELGLHALRCRCPHLDRWLRRLEAGTK